MNDILTPEIMSALQNLLVLLIGSVLAYAARRLQVNSDDAEDRAALHSAMDTAALALYRPATPQAPPQIPKIAQILDYVAKAAPGAIRKWDLLGKNSDIAAVLAEAAIKRLQAGIDGGRPQPLVGPELVKPEMVGARK